MRDKIPYAAQPRLIQMMLDARRIERQIERLKDSARRWESQKYKVTSHISGMPHGGEKLDLCDINQEIDDIMIKVRELERERNTLIATIDTHPDADRLETEEHEALKHKYIRELTHEAIAETMHVSLATVNRKIASGYDKLMICI